MRQRVAIAALVAAGVAGLGIVSGCGDDPAADAAAARPDTVARGGAAVTLGLGTELSVSAPAEAAAGKLDLTVHNAGALTHEFVVVRTPRAASDLADGPDAEADETGAVDEIEDLPAGGTKHLVVTLPAGHYALLCNLPGHYAGGMRADLTVK